MPLFWQIAGDGRADLVWEDELADPVQARVSLREETETRALSGASINAASVRYAPPGTLGVVPGLSSSSITNCNTEYIAQDRATGILNTIKGGTFISAADPDVYGTNTVEAQLRKEITDLQRKLSNTQRELKLAKKELNGRTTEDPTGQTAQTM